MPDTGSLPDLSNGRPVRFADTYAENEALLSWLRTEVFEEVLEPDLPIVDCHHHFWDLRGKLYDDYNERRNARREAKKAARELRDQIQAGIGKAPALRWNTSPEGREARESVKKIRKAEMQFALQPGQMVKLVNDARVAHEGENVFNRTLPKGSIGILIDPPTSQMSAVMFGTDVWRVPTKKLRAADV